jgi:hypothetical protein
LQVGLCCLQARDDRRGVTEQQPPGRSTSRSPTIRSSVAICWLIADCV